MDPQLLNYILAQLEKKIPEQEIRKALKNSGWPGTMVNEAFKTIYSSKTSIKDNSGIGFNIHILRTPRQLLRDTLSIWKDNFFSLIPFVAISIVPTFITGTYGHLLQRNSNMNIAMIILSVVNVIISSWMATAIVFYLNNLQIQPSFSETAWESVRKLPGLWWTLILVTLITIGGYTILFVPGILFSIWFILAPVIAISEEDRGLNAMLKSYSYTKNHWMVITGRIIFVSLFQLLTTAAIVLSAYILSSLIPALGNFPLIFIIITSIIGQAGTAFYLVYLYHLYDDLKSIHGVLQESISQRIKILFIVAGIIGFICATLLPYVVISNKLSLKFPFDFWITTETKKDPDIIRREDIKYLRTIMEIFYAENQKYPNTLIELMPTFVEEIPRDPETAVPYMYLQKRFGQDYELCAKINKKNVCTDANNDLPGS